MIDRITTVWPGKPYPLGATWEGKGVNFALFSEHAGKVELCLFDDKGRREIQRIQLREQTDQVWHCFLPEARPGWLYGYRVYGAYEPALGGRFNPHKLLFDPYAKAIVGSLRWNDTLFGYKVGNKKADLSFDHRDSASSMPKCQIINPAFSWEYDRPPQIPWHDTIIYELHAKGFTQCHPKVPPALRGTYAGLATEPVISHLSKLGITAVELMPIHSFINDRHLVERGLCNYWGYNSIGFFAPAGRYAYSEPVNEFKTLVKTLHRAGIEVILDVVYNHTGEGNQLGPTLCFRGIDNQAYYRLNQDDPRHYMDYTGCGNTLNMTHPRVLQLIMDSLRYWVLDMHVDGFRFDLASSLARELHEVDRLSAFFDILRQDPVLSQVKLIAEPWDLGEGGYQVGNFPVGWVEWNDRYRDGVRAYWKGEGGLIGDLAYRITGSSDLYGGNGRRPYCSINFATAHDGFTLHDLVSYNEKHNEANLEENRDGSNNAFSWNCGAEGPTDDPGVRQLRSRQKRNLLSTLLLSQGVPMLLAGDEMGRSQQGNNNAYCQDNEISWINWDLQPEDHELLTFVRQLVCLRKQHPVFRRQHFFSGRPIKGIGIKDIIWLNPDGEEMSEEEWSQSFARCLGVYLAGEAINERDERDQPLLDDNFLLLLNAHDREIQFLLPNYRADRHWRIMLDTAEEEAQACTYSSGENYLVKSRSLTLFTQEP
ncbi:glycogen debranching protein GlgX [Methyloterricola oryzae]|uniref:glycogen debranching protein GlgX n=1 Tax=Methyloterricola oryzae TaxID=1495050 RepID=UPI0005EB7D00|nr:glycogen debranching protein GlgX [Methyloterricola oryzae]